MASRRLTQRTEEMARSLELTDLVRQFELYNRTEGKSPATVRWYSEILGYFRASLHHSDRSLFLRDVSEQDVREFIVHLQHKAKWEDTPGLPGSNGGLSPYTIGNRVRGLRAFFSWLHRQGYTKENRLANIKAYKVPKKVVEVLTEEEVRMVIGSIGPNTGARAGPGYGAPAARYRAAGRRTGWPQTG